jgi:hypothetical protein
MKISYWDGWFRAKKIAVKPLTEFAALERHQAGKLYTVLVGDPLKPTCFIEVVGENGFVGVEFLDSSLRSELAYGFQRLPDGRMFLSTAIIRKAFDETGKVISAETFHFKPEGTVELRVIDISDDSEKIGHKNLDVSANFESWPEFGNYDHLIQRERGIVH